MKQNCTWQELCHKLHALFAKRQEVPEDYRFFLPSASEGMALVAGTEAVAVLFAWAFYRSLWALLPMQAVSIGLSFLILMRKAKVRQATLAGQFMNLLYTLSDALQAGYSMENALKSAEEDMRQLYGEKALITMELKRIGRGIRSGVPPEDMLEDLGRRSHVEDIATFARVLRVALRTGGNTTETIRRTAAVIGGKLQIDREIRTMLSARRYEQTVLELVPFLLIAYLQLTSPGFFDVLYHNLAGVLIMTIGMVLYGGAIAWSERILEIRA